MIDHNLFWPEIVKPDSQTQAWSLVPWPTKLAPAQTWKYLPWNISCGITNSETRTSGNITVHRFSSGQVWLLSDLKMLKPPESTAGPLGFSQFWLVTGNLGASFCLVCKHDNIYHLLKTLKLQASLENCFGGRHLDGIYIRWTVSSILFISHQNLSIFLMIVVILPRIQPYVSL